MENNNNNATVVASENSNAAANAASENNGKSSFWSKTKKCLLIAGGVLGVVGTGYSAYKYGFHSGYESCMDDNSETFELARRQREYEARKQNNNNI